MLSASENFALTLVWAYEITMSSFSKNQECPSSFELNLFQQGEVSAEEGKEIRMHLRVCDFCSAESDFYARFPQPLESSEEIIEPKMPQPLRELAETLLNQHRGITALESLNRLNDRDR